MLHPRYIAKMLTFHELELKGRTIYYCKFPRKAVELLKKEYPPRLRQRNSMSNPPWIAEVYNRICHSRWRLSNEKRVWKIIYRTTNSHEGFLYGSFALETFRHRPSETYPIKHSYSEWTGEKEAFRSHELIGNQVHSYITAGLLREAGNTIGKIVLS